MLNTSEILRAGILIVDDQEVNIRLLEQLLSEAGYTRVASTMNPLEVCALHRRNDYALILLLEGQLQCQVGDETYGLQPGDSLYLRNGAEYGWENAGDTPARFLLIQPLGYRVAGTEAAD